MSYFNEQNRQAVEFVCNYLRDNPDFFRRHPDVFSHLNLPRQNRDGTRSVIECQNEVLRATLTTMEVREEEFRLREQELLRAKAAEAAMDLAVDLFNCREEVGLPNVVLNFFKQRYCASHGFIRLWPVIPNYSFFAFAERLGTDAESAVSQMKGPFAGENFGDEIAQWLKIDPVETRGVLLVPLHFARQGASGLICLCDPDAQKFSIAQENAFLSLSSRICEAALLPLIN